MQTNPAIAIVAQPVLPPTEADRLRELLEAGAWSPGLVEDPRYPPGLAERASTRRCTLTPTIDPELAARLVLEVRRINVNLQGYTLDGLSADDPMLAMRYGVGDHFDWHIDNALADGPGETRKLSFSLQLSHPASYDGGDLVFAMLEHGRDAAEIAGIRQALRQQGALVVFPSFHLHRVTPVTRGVRVAIVGWMHGPAFT